MPRKAIKKDKEKEPKTRKGAQRYARLRGMKDILPDEHKYWELIAKKAADLAGAYGFERIETPVLERLNLYERATGRDTDIVSKEMYAFTDKSGDRVALRPEATPGLVRAFIEHGMFNLPQPVRFFWQGPVFRHEKPQSGRWRQHTQIDFEIFGEESPVADSQLILIAYNFFSELQIDVQVQINSIGCAECRQAYLLHLTEFYKERGKRSKLCNDCRKRFGRNTLRLLDCKEEACQAIRDEAPQIVDHLCDACREHFIRVLEYLDEFDIPYNLNPFLVRGLDYYNRTVFEVWPGPEEEAGGDGEDAPSAKRQNALGGGGRYDALVEIMGGRPSPACGFAMGIERVVSKIREKNIPLKEDGGDYIFVAQLGDQARRKAFLLFEDLRRQGYNVRQAFTKDSLKAQLETANRLGAKYSLILGQKELMDGTILVRDMESGTQEIIDCQKITAELNKRLNNGENK